MDLAALVDVEDVTDPASMENILIYYEELQDEDDQFMEVLKQRVKDEMITWRQPWYQKVGILARPWSRDKYNDEETNENFRSDAFDTDECEKLGKNWRKFVKRYHVPDKPICLARWKNRSDKQPNSENEKTRQFAVAFLARGLQRNLYQVFRQFRYEYGAPVKGVYSKIEEKVMDICFHNKPKHSAPILSAVLGRLPRGINKRLMVFTKGKADKKRLKWKLPVVLKLVKSLTKHTELPLSKLKGVQLDTDVWLKIQEDMDHSYPYLQLFWNRFLHAQLFIQYDVKLYSLRKKIFKRLLKSSYKVWHDIRWNEFVKQFPDGFTSHFLYYAVQPLLMNYPGNYRTAPLADVIKFGREKAKSMPLKRKEKRLRALVLDEKGDLQTVKHAEKLP